MINKWSRLHHPFKTDRSGISYLKAIVSNFGGDIDVSDGDDNNIQLIVKNIENNFQRILFEHSNTGVRFHLIVHNNNNREQLEGSSHQQSNKNDELKDALQLGLDTIRDSHEENHFVVKSIVTLNDSSTTMTTQGRDCHEINFDSIHKKSNSEKINTGLFNYGIHIIYNCDNQQIIQIEMNKFGTIMIRLPSKISKSSNNNELVAQILEEKIAPFLTTQFLVLPTIDTMNPKMQEILSTTSLTVINTIIDSDPLSYMDSMQGSSKKATISPIEHHQLLTRVFQEQMNQSIAKMIDVLSFSNINNIEEDDDVRHRPTNTGLYQSTEMIYYGLTFSGQDFAQQSTYNEYDDVNVPNDYTISGNDAKYQILNGEIGQFIINNAKLDESVLNMILFVPPKANVPLYVIHDNLGISSWSQAFHIKSKDTIMSIVNIIEDTMNPELEQYQRESIYTFAIREAISYIGASIRQQLGLAGSIEPDHVEKETIATDNDEIGIEIHYTPLKHVGIAPFEVDKLQRQSWSIKVHKAVQKIERIVTLVQARNAIAFRLEVMI